MARNAEKRLLDGVDLPLDLAPPKRFKFMIDHLLDEDKAARLSNSNASDAACATGACASSETCATVCGEVDDSTEEATQSESDAAEPLPKTCPAAGNSPSLRRVECRLEGRELWNKFYELSTEMIITKSGRYVKFLQLG
ncbi:unnamed protein product [Toxocara canis]|uniref:T-box domain-containing protein n=1 Tax=Toxocara canis TaxID=6265 RepID=A0A183UEG2_TOXCA|nr:unnamed protein product [Toxocara canis]